MRVDTLATIRMLAMKMVHPETGSATITIEGCSHSSC